MHSSFPESGGSTAILLRGQSGTGGAQLELLYYLVSSYLNTSGKRKNTQTGNGLRFSSVRALTHRFWQAVKQNELCYQQ